MQPIAAQWKFLPKEDKEHLQGFQRSMKDLQATKQTNIRFRKSFNLNVRGCLMRMTEEDHIYILHVFSWCILAFTLTVSA